MVTLKSDLDDYLLQNDSRRGFNWKLPEGWRPRWATPASASTPTSSSSSSGREDEEDGWFATVKKCDCFPSLTRTQRMIGFASCMMLGLLCFFLSFLFLPVLILKARKFALLYTFGSIFFIMSFSFLHGPWNHIKQLFSKERVLSTVLYGGALFATLYSALHLQSTIATIIFAVLQIIILVWITLGSVPGGASGMRFFGNIFKSSASNEALTCNVCDRSFPSQRQLESHQQKKRHFGCSTCDSLYLSLMALEHHKEEFQHWSDDEEYCSAGYDSDSSEDTAPSEDCERLL